MKILYVGNDLSYFEAELADRELKVKQVRNGFEAIKELGTEPHYGAILCEYNLPGNHGIYLFEKIKEQADQKQIPFEQKMFFTHQLFAYEIFRKI